MMLTSICLRHRRFLRQLCTRTPVLVLFALLLGAPVAAENKTVYLTSLEWPPYTGRRLPQQGASVAVARAAFKAMGYTLIVEFYPWSRTVYLAKSPATRYAGYFPEYHSDTIAETFLYSDVIGTGPLGFAQRVDKPVTWSALDDLADLTIGVVRDYVNTPEFDRRVAEGRLQVEAAGQDRNNLKKLAAGRLDLVVIDKYVMNHLLGSERNLIPLRGKLSFNPHLLEEKKLYICFKRTPRGEQLKRIFNEGLKRIDIDAIMADFMAE